MSSIRRGCEQKRTVLVTAADLAQPALALLDDYDVVFAGKNPSETDIIELCKQHDPVGIIVRYSKIGTLAMDAAPSLQVISKHGSGTDTIDKHAAQERGIKVVAAVGANAAAVAEHAIALMLACAKSITTLDARMRAGHWDKAIHKNIELSGRTLGLIGLGAIGQRVARVALAMDMRVIGYDPFATGISVPVERVDLDSIWSESDVISLHCPLNDANRCLLNKLTLACCKTGVILVNTARGGLVDEEALLEAVQSGHVLAAGLDSFVVEPMVAGHPFCREPNIILSPHIGGVTHDAYVNMGVASARNLLAELKSCTQST